MRGLCGLPGDTRLAVGVVGGHLKQKLLCPRPGTNWPLFHIVRREVGISGVVGKNATVVNGLYLQTGLLTNGMETFKKRGAAERPGAVCS